MDESVCVWGGVVSAGADSRFLHKQTNQFSYLLHGRFTGKVSLFTTRSLFSRKQYRSADCTVAPRNNKYSLQTVALVQLSLTGAAPRTGTTNQEQPELLQLLESAGVL